MFLPRSLLSLLLILLALSAAAAHGGHADSDSDADTGTEHPDLRARPLILVKIWCLIIVFFATFVGGVSPYFLKWNEAFLVLGTQFAGGVFLGTAMMHFLSDSNETFGDLTEKEYPFAFMLACGGYLLTMMADCAIGHVYGKQRIENGAGDVELQGSVQVNQLKSGHDPASHQASLQTAAVASLGDSVLLIVALCFHSVFEGIAIGIAETTDNAWKALWTICLHKVFAAIAMGIALLRMLPDRPLLSTVLYALAFAISSPIGVAIGIVIDETTQGNVADWIYAISMGVATGIFIYVSINHLLVKGYIPQKIVSSDTPLYKLLAVTLGVGVIAVVMIWDT
uniref:Zinc transporter 11 n=1 Tax=Kalanchoe fedtschenkoi TaxID=63787 RepID=A0A7N0U3P3_KALFE